jgi:hypothetical protein
VLLGHDRDPSDAGRAVSGDGGGRRRAGGVVPRGVPAGAHVVRLKRATTLVTTGVYAYTRNPGYVGVALLFSSIAVATGTWWALATIAAELIVVDRRVVVPEEHYLEHEFRDTYRHYMARTRRWIYFLFDTSMADIFTAMADGPSLASLIVPAAAALAGVSLGKFWDHLMADSRWHREQRAQAYAAFIAAIEAVYIEMSQTTEDFSETRVDDCLREATRTGAVVDMFGSAAVAQCAHKVWNFAALELNCHEVRTLTAAEWLPVSQRFRQFIDDFRDSARKELGQESLVGRSYDLTPK